MGKATQEYHTQTKHCMPQRYKVISNMNSKWQSSVVHNYKDCDMHKAHHSPIMWFLIYYQQEATEIQPRIINEWEFEFQMSFTYHIVTR